jgi:DNA helicase-2/ATP-dependent DNA helicase PcrA
MGDAFDRLLRLIMIKVKSNMPQMRTQVAEDIIELANLVKRFALNKTEKESLRRYLSQSDATSIVKGLVALAKYSGPLKGANVDCKMSLVMADAISRFLAAKSVAESLLVMGVYFEGLQMDFGKAQDDIFFADPPFLQLAEYALRYGDDYGQFVEDIERAKNQLAYIPPFEDDDKVAWSFVIRHEATGVNEATCVRSCNPTFHLASVSTCDSGVIRSICSTGQDKLNPPTQNPWRRLSRMQ